MGPITHPHPKEHIQMMEFWVEDQEKIIYVITIFLNDPLLGLLFLELLQTLLVWFQVQLTCTLV